MRKRAWPTLYFVMRCFAVDKREQKRDLKPRQASAWIWVDGLGEAIDSPGRDEESGYQHGAESKEPWQIDQAKRVDARAASGIAAPSGAAASESPGGGRWGLGRYRIVLWTTLVLVLGSGLLRAVLLMRFSGGGFGAMTAAWAFGVGFAFDLLVAMVVQLPQVLHMTLHGDRRVNGRLSRAQVHGGLIVTFAGMLFVLAAEYCFFEEFDSRLNYIAFEYLIYPTEVVTNIWESYPLLPILAGIGVAAVLIYLPMRGMTRRALADPTRADVRWLWLTGWCVGIAMLWLSLGRSAMQVSENRVVNQIAGNGVWTFVENAWTSRFDYDVFYPTLAAGEAERLAAAAVFRSGDRAVANGVNALDRIVDTGRPRQDWNVVLILEESLGSDFVGALGDGRGLTPNLDRLTHESLLFDNFYATGNRTARALEATLTGLPPIPTESILKRDHSGHVESLGRILKQRGYATMFVYGGRGMFDGMRSFMTANGFDRFIEQSDYLAPEFSNAWGVDDEAIMDMALRKCRVLDEQQRPFFMTVLSVTNHQPFTYPPNRIDEPADAHKREHGVKYADYALGRFFDRAKREAFFDRTVFVVLGDHGARVYGSQRFPLESYRVPVWMFLPGGGSAGQRNSVMSCSLDIAPTILGQLGGTYRTVMFGRDAATATPAEGRALMQHNHDLALLTQSGQLSVLSLNEEPARFVVDFSQFEVKPAPPDEALARKEIAIYQTANDLYYADRYRQSDAGIADSQPVEDGSTELN